MLKALSALAAAGFVLAACASHSPTVQTTSATLPPPNAAGEYQVPWPVFGRGNERFVTIQLGPDLYQWCRDVSPKFPFDSASTYVSDRAQLVALASCLNHPGLESRRLLLVGRTDPRGGEEYNMDLGYRRARWIKEFLVSAGLSADRIDVTSAGELDSKGKLPDYSYGYDRRVEIRVTGGAHHP